MKLSTLISFFAPTFASKRQIRESTYLRMKIPVQYLIIIAILGIMAGGGCGVLSSLKTKNYSPQVWISWDEYLNKFVGKNISTAQTQFGYKYLTKDLPEGE